MHYEDKLIFEAYTGKSLLNEETNRFLEENFPNLITEEEKEGWLWTAAKVLDPTGLLSWGDLGRAYDNYVEDQNLINFGLLLIGIFNVLPNFGLLAAGVGGVGWAGLKGTLKAASKNPSLIAKAMEKFFGFLRAVPGVKSTLIKGIEKAASSGVIKSPKVAEQLIETVRTGVLPAALTATSKKAGTLTRAAERAQGAGLRGLDAAKDTLTQIGPRAGDRFLKQGASRFLTTFGPAGLGTTYPGFLPKSILPREMENKVSAGAADLFGTGGDEAAIAATGGSQLKNDLLNYIRQNRG
jgi:hypothetical protein